MNHLRLSIPFFGLIAFIIVGNYSYAMAESASKAKSARPTTRSAGRAPDSPSGRKIALLAGGHRPIKTMTAAEWFSEFDKIDHKAKLPSKQRNNGALLMMRALAGVGQSKEDLLADEILRDIAVRYERAAQQIERLPKVNETEPLQTGFTEYYRGTAKLCEDCANLKTVDAASKTFRRLSGEEIELLTQRKKKLDDLLSTCRWADAMTRVKYRCRMAPEYYDDQEDY